LRNFGDSTAPSVPLSDLTERLYSSGFEQHFGQNEFRKNAPVHHARFAVLLIRYKNSFKDGFTKHF
jgi:hypothetical protein